MQRRCSVTKRLYIVAFIFFLSFFTYLSSVSAHANLLRSEPQDGEVLQSSPHQIRLSFSEFIELESLSIRLFDWNGKEITLSPPNLISGDASRALADLPPLLEGSYTVDWKLLSEDGHPVGSSYIFSVDKASPGSSAPISTGTSLVSDSILVPIRLLVETLLLVAGGLFSVSKPIGRSNIYLFHQLQRRSTPMFGSVLLVAVLAQGIAYVLVIDTLDISVLSHSPFMIMVLAQFFLLLLLAIPRMQGGWYQSVWALIIASLAIGGHVWGIEQTWLAISLRVIHVWTIALWLGALLCLLLSLRQKPLDPHHPLVHQRTVFLRLLLVASGGAVASGIAMVSLQSDWALVVRLDSLWSGLLLVKLGLVLLMLVLAIKQTRRWRKEETTLSLRLLRWEISFGFLAIVAGVWMSQTSYPSVY